MAQLNPDDLTVSSFETTSSPDQDVSLTLQTNYDLCTQDPTSLTRCFICPPVTSPERTCAFE